MARQITIPVGQSTGSSAAFAVRADDAYVQGTQTLNVSVTGTTGGNFEALTTTGTATTTVTDDADPTRRHRHAPRPPRSPKAARSSTPPP